jgi:uncharacterized membrane protein
MELKVAQSVVIDLPAEEIFAYIADVENAADWSGFVINIRKTSPGTLQVGATLRATSRFLGRWLESTYEVVECEPGHHITFKSLSGVVPWVFYYLFEALEEGRTRVVQEAVIHLKGGLLGLPGPMAASTISRQLEHDLLTLKDILEARASIQQGS